MKMTQPDPFDLETAFEAARAAPARVPDALAARILADAAAFQPRRPLWLRFVVAVGGPAGVGGLVTATVAGFWFGLARPVEGYDPLVLVTASEVQTSNAYNEVLGFGWYGEEG